MRVGLVLGAGGVIGGSWLMGALEALEAETGWRASEAELVVGTSAGSVIGAMAAAGVRSEYISAYAAGARWTTSPRPSCARWRRRHAPPRASTGSSGRCRHSARARGGWRPRR